VNFFDLRGGIEMSQYKRFLVLVIFFALSLSLLAQVGVHYDTVDWRAYMNAYVPAPSISLLPTSGALGLR
jgi:hypothetical protein